MKKLIILTALVLAAVLALVGCTSGTAVSNEPSIQKISPEDAKEMMDTSGVIVFDVRTQDEYDAGHIDGARLLPYDSINRRIPRPAVG